jgi:7,8-dihydro-6-hydroxymethylpterin-pyrophosphokinase
MSRHDWLLLLGSGLADAKRVHDALAALATLGPVTPLTPIRRIPGREDVSRAYHNVLVILACALDRVALRTRLKEIETALGRERGSGKPVAIDIDLLATRRNDRWQADPHALEKNEFTQTPARELLAQAGVAIDQAPGTPENS